MNNKANALGQDPARIIPFSYDISSHVSLKVASADNAHVYFEIISVFDNKRIVECYSEPRFTNCSLKSQHTSPSVFSHLHAKPLMHLESIAENTKAGIPINNQLCDSLKECPLISLLYRAPKPTG